VTLCATSQSFVRDVQTVDASVRGRRSTGFFMDTDWHGSCSVMKSVDVDWRGSCFLTNDECIFLKLKLKTEKSDVCCDVCMHSTVTGEKK